MRLEISPTRAIALVAFGLAGILLLAPAVAKAPVDKIIVEGTGIAQPIEIVDTDALDGFDPWGRRFIDWDKGPAHEPPSGALIYTVSFYLEGSVIFVLQYASDPASGIGYIYIPGPEHPDYRLNSRTIIGASSDRWNPNGKWQYATTAWSALMPDISRMQPPATGDGGLR